VAVGMSHCLEEEEVVVMVVMEKGELLEYKT